MSPFSHITPHRMIFKQRRPAAFFKAACTLLLLLFVSFCATAAERLPASREYPIKAAFLYNFTKYVEWPSVAHTNAQSPIVITILGKNPFGSALESIVEGRSVNGRRVVVRYATDIETIKPSHILFIPKSENSITGNVIESLKGQPILIVGESDEFKKERGMVNLSVESSQVRFEINIAAAEAVHLKISSQLQKLAKEITRN